MANSMSSSSPTPTSTTTQYQATGQAESTPVAQPVPIPNAPSTPAPSGGDSLSASAPPATAAPAAASASSWLPLPTNEPSGMNEMSRMTLADLVSDDDTVDGMTSVNDTVQQTTAAEIANTVPATGDTSNNDQELDENAAGAQIAAAEIAPIVSVENTAAPTATRAALVGAANVDVAKLETTTAAQVALDAASKNQTTQVDAPERSAASANSQPQRANAHGGHEPLSHSGALQSKTAAPKNHADKDKKNNPSRVVKAIDDQEKDGDQKDKDSSPDEDDAEEVTEPRIPRPAFD